MTDGLSNTVVAGEKTPYLADATWVGIIPGYRHFAYNAFASAGTGGLGVNYDYAERHPRGPQRPVALRGPAW